MNIPVTVKLPRGLGINTLGDWMLARKILDRISHNWSEGTLSFEDEEDALAFCLTFGAERCETTLERMVKNETSSD